MTHQKNENQQTMEKKHTISLNILVTSISKKISLLKCLKQSCKKLRNEGTIIGADSDKGCIGRNFVDLFWEMPKIDKLQIDELLDFCKKNNVKCIIPTRDDDLPFFARHKKVLFKKKIHVMVSDYDPVLTCYDKLLFFKNTKNLGFPVIDTSNKIDEINSANYVVKEQFGAGSRKIALKVTKNHALTHSHSLSHPIFQPFIEGKEVSVDLYVTKKGKTKGAVVRTRDLIIDGESQITESIRNSKLEQVCSSLAEKLQLYGHVVLQVIIDSTEKFHIIECNNRFGGASTLSFNLGLESFYWFLLEALGENLDSYLFVRSKTEKKLIRYPEDVIN